MLLWNYKNAHSTYTDWLTRRQIHVHHWVRYLHCAVTARNSAPTTAITNMYLIVLFHQQVTDEHRKGLCQSSIGLNLQTVMISLTEEAGLWHLPLNHIMKLTFWSVISIAYKMHLQFISMHTIAMIAWLTGLEIKVCLSFFNRPVRAPGCGAWNLNLSMSQTA